MDWQNIAQRDPYQAGSIAARGHEWWMEETAEQEANSAGLTGERSADFIRGWNDEIADQKQERDPQVLLVKDADQAIREHGKLWGLEG